MNISHSEQLSKVNALQDNVIFNVDFKYSWVFMQDNFSCNVNNVREIYF